MAEVPWEQAITRSGAKLREGAEEHVAHAVGDLVVGVDHRRGGRGVHHRARLGAVSSTGRQQPELGGTRSVGSATILMAQ